MTNSRILASAASVAIALAATASPAATLSGTITANGRGVDSAVVSVYGTTLGARKLVTITNAAGTYRVANVQSGTCIVIVEKDGRRIYQGPARVVADPARFDVRL